MFSFLDFCVPLYFSPLLLFTELPKGEKFGLSLSGEKKIEIKIVLMAWGLWKGAAKGAGGRWWGRKKGISSISEEWWVKSLTEDF